MTRGLVVMGAGVLRAHHTGEMSATRHAHSRKGNRVRMRKTMGALGAFVAAALVALTPGAASPAAADPGRWTYVGDLSYQLGANVWNDGEIVGFCTKDTQDGPNGVGLGSTQPYTDIITIQAGDPYTPASTSQGDAAGKVVPGANTGKLAYLLSKGTPAARSGNANETMAYHYAINSLSVSGTFAEQNAVGQSVKNRAADLLSEAGSNAGPYTVPLDVNAAMDAMSGTVTGIGVKNASGGWMSGYGYTITISGPAAFDSNGSTSISGTTSGSAQSLAWHSTDNGKVRFTMTVTGLPAASFQVYRHQTAQDIFVAGSASSAQGQTDPIPVSMDFQPTLSSQVKPFSITAGETFQDTVTVGVAEGDTWVRTLQGEYVEVLVEGTLYGYEEQVPAESDTVPADAVVLDTVTFTASGPGEYDVESTIAAASADGGRYAAWTWRIVKANQPEDVQKYIRGDASDGYFVESETHVVQVTPEVVTEADAQYVDEGDPAIDNVTVSLADGQVWPTDRDGQTVEIPVEMTLWKIDDNYPQGESDTIPADAEQIGTETLTFTSEGTQATSGDVTFGGKGIYTWTAEIEESDYYEGFTSAFEIVQESSSVRYPISHASETREYNVVPGGRAFDTIHITGFPTFHGDWAGIEGWDADRVEATVTVYGPLSEAPSTEEVPADAPVFWQDTITATNGTFAVGYDEDNPITPTEPGYYVFVYSFAGDTVIAPYTSPFNDVLERFYVPGNPTVEIPPTVTTQAQEEAWAGETAIDTALVTGTVDEDMSLTWDVYRTERAEDAECVAPDEATVADLLAAGPVASVGPVTVTTDGYYESPEVEVGDTNACIWWVEKLTDENGDVVDEGKIGNPGEVTKVTVPPRETTVTTKAMSDSDTPVVGDSIWDTIQVDGDILDGDYTVVNLYTWETGSEPTCENPVWTSEEIALTPGTTEYTTGTFVTVEAKEHGFVETTYDAEGEMIAQGECGTPDETITVTGGDEDEGGASTDEGDASGDLATTGIDPTMLLLIAAGLVTAGVGTTVAVSRRKNAVQ